VIPDPSRPRHRATRALAVLALLACGVAAAAGKPAPRPGDALVVGRPLSELADDLKAGRTTSVALVDAYLARIAALNRTGPSIRAVIAVNPEARAEARALDAERRAGHVRGPLHGVPVLVKDNVETADPVATTAGSLALKDNITRRDAPAIARLRAAGAVILGKTNLSEWANFRSTSSTSGWSGVGGLVRNPWALDRTACGSSSGSGAAVAASFAAAAVGTETDGSILCPSSVNGLVGLKPTVGLVSRTHVVPISASQDTAGPMARTVRDAALLLAALAGSDPADPATAEADRHREDYAAALRPDALAGVRIGVARFLAGSHSPTTAAFERGLARLRAAGAELVEITESGIPSLGADEHLILTTEFKAGLNAYLASTPDTVKVRSLADLIAFNRAHAAEEMPWFGQELLELSETTAGLDDPAYKAARDRARRAAGPDGIDRLLAEHKVAMLVAPTMGPPWMIDLVNGDQSNLPSADQLAAVAGYPHVTVPMGDVKGLPVGMSFFGPAWSEAKLLAAAYAFEQRGGKPRVATLAPTIDGP
jgi:amidase